MLFIVGYISYTAKPHPDSVKTKLPGYMPQNLASKKCNDYWRQEVAVVYSLSIYNQFSSTYSFYSIMNGPKLFIALLPTDFFISASASAKCIKMENVSKQNSAFRL